MIGGIPRMSDRARHAVVPGLRLTNRENDLSAGIMLAHLAPEMCGRPVDGGTIAGIGGIPVRQYAFAGSTPKRLLLGICDDVGHMVARSEPDLLQRKLERIGARAPHSRAYDFKDHEHSPCRMRSAGRGQLAPGTVLCLFGKPTAEATSAHPSWRPLRRHRQTAILADISAPGTSQKEDGSALQRRLYGNFSRSALLTFTHAPSS